MEEAETEPQNEVIIEEESTDENSPLQEVRSPENKRRRM